MEDLKELMNNGVALVDNSSSTGWYGCINLAKQVVEQFGVPRVSFWNNKSSPPVDTSSAFWKPCGGTHPECAYAQIPPGTKVILFLTDGLINDTTRVAKEAAPFGHIPVIFVLFSNLLKRSTRMADINISVFMSHYSVAHTSAICVRDSAAFRILCSKGHWEDSFALPPIEEKTLLSDFPVVDLNKMMALRTSVMEKADGNVVYIDHTSVNLDLLMSVGDPFEFACLVDEFSSSARKDIVRTLFAMGRSNELRRVLNRLNLSMNSRETSDHLAEHDLVKSLISGGQTDLATLQQAVASREDDQFAGFAPIYNEFMRLLHEVESSGHQATSLSNRVDRAASVESLEDLDSLDLTGSPEAEDAINLTPGPVCLLLGIMGDPESNKEDYALDQPLSVGQNESNSSIFSTPCIVGLQNKAASMIESLGINPLTRESTSLCLPVIKLDNSENREAVYERLCKVFLGGKKLPHVWQIALSSIFAALEAPAWQEPVRKGLLEFMCTEILNNVTLPAGARLCPGKKSLTLLKAYETIVGDPVVTQDSGMREASTMVSILWRFSPIDQTFLKKCVQARIATLIPQTFLRGLKRGERVYEAFLQSICQTRSSTVSGKAFPIAGGEHPLSDIENIFHPNDLEAMRKFDNIITPGHSLVVAKSLSLSTHLKDSVAVDTVRKSCPICTLEMCPPTSGITPWEACLPHMRLSEAKEPSFVAPFVTPFGASVTIFYTPDGTQISMDNGGNVEKIREARASLMKEHYSTLDDGGITRDSACSSLQKEMSNVALQNPGIIDRDPEKFVTMVIDSLVDRDSERAGNVSSRTLEDQARALIPSLRESLRLFPDTKWNPKVSLLQRLNMENTLTSKPPPVKV